MRLHILTFFCIVLSNVGHTNEQEVVSLYTYHYKPPFVVDIDNKQGLYFDLANYLSKASSIYDFTLTYIPRKRLEHVIANNQLNGVVIGVSPLWFKDKSEKKYLWLPPFYADRDEFISLKSSPFDYLGQDSLLDKTIASVAGYYYFNINEAVAKGELFRIDTVGEIQVLELIKKQRAELGLVSRSVFKFLRKQNELEDIFYFSPLPHDSFNRRAFTTQDNRKVHAEMHRLMKHLDTDENWRKMIAQYE